jgi:CBS domain-containing protein
MLTVADVMTRDVAVVSPETSLRELIEMLSEHRVSGMPVVSGETVLGVVSTTDVMAFLAGEMQASDSSTRVPDEIPERQYETQTCDSYLSTAWDDQTDVVLVQQHCPAAESARPLGEFVVRDLMTSPARSISPDADVREAADVMKRARIHRILVLDGARLVGIVTTTDLMRAVAESRLRSPDSYVDIDLRSWP